MNTTKITMSALVRQKAEIRAKILRKNDEFSRIYWDTLAPFYRLGNSPLSLLKHLSVGFAFFNGILTSVRLVRRVKSWFRR
ncbi:MAG: hypothetical protein LUI04_05255 [Porphyromonadaceae bacterium]|nr:hypothetical protein [Porphyromonadaceae bacterium]